MRIGFEMFTETETPWPWFSIRAAFAKICINQILFVLSYALVYSDYPITHSYFSMDNETTLGLLFTAPILETVLLVFAFEVFRLFKVNMWITAMAVALYAAYHHSTEGYAIGFYLGIGFVAYVLIYNAYRDLSIKKAVGLLILVHFLNNLFVWLINKAMVTLYGEGITIYLVRCFIGAFQVPFHAVNSVHIVDLVREITWNTFFQIPSWMMLCFD